jgi:protein gp37
VGENSKIEWTHHTFNPWFGCMKVGPGCDHCYAEEMMDRRYGRARWGAGQARVRTSAANWKLPLKWNRACAKAGIRERVFCASLADVFDNEIDPAWRADLFELIRATPHLDWLLLTKRIGNAANMLPVPFDFERLYPNVWLGATIVNRAEMLRDAPKLKATPARVRFWSGEPLLGDLGPIPSELLPDWIIVGGESGRGARPMLLPWAQKIRDQCAAAGVPFMFKQWGEWIPAGQTCAQKAPIREFGYDQDARCRYHRVGKKAAGRLLDGVQHDGVAV